MKYEIIALAVLSPSGVKPAKEHVADIFSDMEGLWLSVTPGLSGDTTIWQGSLIDTLSDCHACTQVSPVGEYMTYGPGQISTYW